MRPETTSGPAIRSPRLSFSLYTAGSIPAVTILYLLNFLSPFTTYSAFQGTPIFWVPASNSAANASINVNGIGVVGIYNANGSQLGANQIIANYITQIVYQSNIANSGNSGFVLLLCGSLTGSIVGTFGQEIPLASASTVDLGSAPAHTVQITGTTTISSFGSSASILAPYYLIRFSGAMQLTYNATSMVLPGNATITTALGDSAMAQYLGNGNWRVAFYQYSQSASSSAKIKPADTAMTSNATLTPDPDLQSNTLAVGRYSYELLLIFDSVAAGAGFKWTNDGTAVDSRALMPGLVSGYVNGAAVGPITSSFYATTISYATVGTGANSNQVLYKGSMLVGTAGTLGVSWAQDASTASATTLRAGSYLITTLLNTGSSANQVTRVYKPLGQALKPFLRAIRPVRLRYGEDRGAVERPLPQGPIREEGVAELRGLIPHSSDGDRIGRGYLKLYRRCCRCLRTWQWRGLFGIERYLIDHHFNRSWRPDRGQRLGGEFTGRRRDCTDCNGWNCGQYLWQRRLSRAAEYGIGTRGDWGIWNTRCV